MKKHNDTSTAVYSVAELWRPNWIFNTGAKHSNISYARRIYAISQKAIKTSYTLIYTRLWFILLSPPQTVVCQLLGKNRRIKKEKLPLSPLAIFFYSLHVNV